VETSLWIEKRFRKRYYESIKTVVFVARKFVSRILSVDETSFNWPGGIKANTYYGFAKYIARDGTIYGCFDDTSCKSIHIHVCVCVYIRFEIDATIYALSADSRESSRR